MNLSSVAEAERTAVSDVDRDSLHTLPLVIMPVRTAALKRARLIKNARLETVVEVFSSLSTGSGQIAIDDCAKEFGWPEVPTHPDMELLRRLGGLPSFDVYSLRILLREADIPVDATALKLSSAKTRELSTYMGVFTRPLIKEVYGDDSVGVEDFTDMLQIFRDPDAKKVRQRLQTIAGKLKVGIHDIPRFLEDYGDIFLSLSYYRQCLDSITPSIRGFSASMAQIRRNHQLRSDQNLMNTCRMMESVMNERLVAVSRRLESFERSTGELWEDMTAESFRRVEELIKGYHTTIGGILCALAVKMHAWNNLFPTNDTGGPVRRAEFIMSELKQGMNRIQRIDDSAPTLAAMG